jgi:hypothetical protein
LFTIKGQILTLLLPQETSQAEKAAAETFSRKLLRVSKQAFESLNKKNLEAKILLVRIFKEMKGDSTGSSNSKPFQR